MTPLPSDREAVGRPDGGMESDSRWVVVYDGSCGYCRRQVEKMRARDAAGLLLFLPRDTEGILERFPVLAREDFNSGMRVISPEGRLFVGADGVYQIARRVSGWRWWAWLYRVPVLHAMFRLAYGWIAKNRYRLGGNASSCQVREPR